MRSNSFLIFFFIVILLSAPSCNEKVTDTAVAETSDTTDLPNTIFPRQANTVQTIKWFFYEKGKPSVDGVVKSRSFRDSSGCELKLELFDRNGRMESYHFMEYSKTGNVLHSTSYNSSGEMIKEENLVYDTNDSLIKSTFFSAPFTLMGYSGKTEHLWDKEYKYDKKGKRNYIMNKQIKENYFTLDQFEFDENGREIKKLVSSGKNNEPMDSCHTDTYLTTYDVKGNKKTWTWLSGKDTISKNSFLVKYSNDSLSIVITEKGEDKKEWSRVEIKKDKAGRIIERKKYSLGNKAQFEFFQFHDNNEVKSSKVLEFSLSYIPDKNKTIMRADTLIRINDVKGREIESHNYSSNINSTTHKKITYDDKGRISEIIESNKMKTKGSKLVISGSGGKQVFPMDMDQRKLVKYTYEIIN